MTITFRIDEKRRAALRKHANALGKSESELLRDLVDRGLGKSTVAERIGSLLGSVTLDKATMENDSWRSTIRKNNWRE